MRSVLVVLVLAGLATAAGGDPIRIELLRDRTRHTDANVRAAAAEQLAKLRGSELAAGTMASAVISDDPTVRSILVDALVREDVIVKAGAIHVPTASVMERMLPRLYPRRSGIDLPPVTSCSLISATARSASVHCTISRCENVLRVTLAFEITTGVRWSGAEPQRTAVRDGSCGEVM